MPRHLFQADDQSRSQSFVPLDQRSENESSGSNHYERTKEITEFWLSGSLRICIYGACLKWLLPELSFSDRWSKGTRLWERDWLMTFALTWCANIFVGCSVTPTFFFWQITSFSDSFHYTKKKKKSVRGKFQLFLIYYSRTVELVHGYRCK